MLLKDLLQPLAFGSKVKIKVSGDVFYTLENLNHQWWDNNNLNLDIEVQHVAIDDNYLIVEIN